ncbi:MAG: Hpt domain-containing protein [Acidobacteria bacterium]|nr:Hpt domain-containing protein [Acidobacteriota bacterium]
MELNQTNAESCAQRIVLSDRSAAIDQQALTDLWKDMDENEDIIRELIRIFLDDARQQMSNAHQSLATANPIELGRIAHTLKGSSLYYGAKKLAEICGLLETICRQGQLPQAASLIREIETEFEMVKEALRSLEIHNA